MKGLVQSIKNFEFYLESLRESQNSRKQGYNVAGRVCQENQSGDKMENRMEMRKIEVS